MSPQGMAGRLRAARTAAGISARELARIAGISAAHVGLIETGARARVEARTASRLAAALGVTLDWLVDGRGREPSARALRAAVSRAQAAAHVSTDE